MSERLEAQCDCELDSPGMMPDHSIEQRLDAWWEWALYLKSRIETHYRPRIAVLEAEVEALKDELAKCESQKRGLAAAAKRGLSASAEVERLKWQLDTAAWDYLRKTMRSNDMGPGTLPQYLADLEARWQERTP